MMDANRTRFSPAGPTMAVCSAPRSRLSSMCSTTSGTSAPARSLASSNSTPESVTWTPTRSSLSPTSSTAAFPVARKFRDMKPPAFEDSRPSVSGETAVAFIRPVKLIREVWSGPVVK